MDHRVKPGDDHLKTLGFGPRLKLLEPGVATLIEVPHHA
jgi:hypothetical protein